MLRIVKSATPVLVLIRETFQPGNVSRTPAVPSRLHRASRCFDPRWDGGEIPVTSDHVSDKYLPLTLLGPTIDMAPDVDGWFYLALADASGESGNRLVQLLQPLFPVIGFGVDDTAPDVIFKKYQTDRLRGRDHR